jgi:adenylosuccinate lyase
MQNNNLLALSPLDGRYASKGEPLRHLFSEQGLIHLRLLVEVRWVQFLADHPGIPEIGPFPAVVKSFLDAQITDFDSHTAQRVKDIEAVTNHDVKAVEYFIRERLGDGPETATLKDFLHFGCTSEDINNCPMR